MRPAMPIQQALETAAAKHPNITLVPDMVAIDLVTGRHATHFSTSGAVHGLYAYNRKKKRVETLTGRATILATGGAGRAYLYSTAPRGATGDGIAMAWRAGCRVSNMEIHPVPPDLPLQSAGQEFPDHRGGARRGRACSSYRRSNGGAPLHAAITTSAQSSRRATSSPARSTTRSSATGSTTCILDITHREPEFVQEHFPNIYDKLLGLGIDITSEPIPVVPAQHYTCGGVVVDLDGRTDAPGLYAAGEVTAVGPARRQPPRLQQPARMPGVRRSGGEAHRGQLGRRCPTCRKSAPGTKAASPTATRKS